MLDFIDMTDEVSEPAPEPTLMNKLANILPVLGDTGLGLIAVTITAVSFNEPYSLLFVSWVLLWAYLPDLDGLLHFFNTNHFVADIEHGRDHREGLHYPLFWALMFSVVVYIFGLNAWTFSAVLVTVFHFLHDMIGVGWGVQILAPFDMGSYRLFSKKWVSADISLWPILIRYSPEEQVEAIRNLGEVDWIDRYFCRLTPVSVIDYGLFVLGCVMLLATLFA